MSDEPDYSGVGWMLGPGPDRSGSGFEVIAKGLRRAVKPLASRKVRVALVTVIAAIGAEFGFEVSEEIVLTMLGVGVAVILGIAIEDHATKSRGPSRAERGEFSRPDVHRDPARSGQATEVTENTEDANGGKKGDV